MAEFRKELQMSKSRTTLFLCALTFCLIGTGVYWYVDNQTTDAAVVAVIDLDEVARRIGADEQVNSAAERSAEPATRFHSTVIRERTSGKAE